MGIHTDACTVSLIDVGSENIMVKKSNLIGGANGKKAKGHLYMQHGEANPIANLSLMFIGNVCIDPHMFRPDDKDSTRRPSPRAPDSHSQSGLWLNGVLSGYRWRTPRPRQPDSNDSSK